MKKQLTILIAVLCLASASVWAQTYVSTPVTVSTEKARYGDKIYYIHQVLERQTLFSICKAYGVTEQDLYDSNKDLKEKGLQTGQILMIPVKEQASTEASAQDQASVQTSTPNVALEPQQSEFFTHKVKWFEDLNSIASDYGVSKESIMNINRMTSEKLKRKQILKIPRNPSKWESASADADAASEEASAVTETAGTEESSEGIFEDIFVREGSHDVGMALVLPLGSGSGSVNQLMMDFYCGAMLSAKDLGEAGMNLNVSVYDSDEGASFDSGIFSGNNFTIGPVSNSDILKAARASSGEGWIVSPLDPKAEALADTVANVIQAPAPTEAQIRDMVSWVKSETRSGDKVILVTQKDAGSASYESSVVRDLSDAGLEYSVLSFGILEGREVPGRLSGMLSQDGTTRVIMVSDSEAFAIEVVRNIYLLRSKDIAAELYTTSKIRTFDTIDIEQLHKTGLHVSSSYFVDYTSARVQEFILAYRELYGAEPTQFAFQGYDLMTYFATVANKYGRRWERGMKRISMSGLQADFDLERTARGGYVNKAVRRMVYEPDYTVKSVR